MSIIRELARDSVKTDRQGSFAVSVSIFFAVLLVGFFLIVFSLIDYGQVAYMTETTGGYSAELIARGAEDMAELKKDHRVKRLSIISREVLEDDSLNRPKSEINYLDAYLYDYKWVELVSGRYPENAGELLVSELFLIENPSFKIGSDITIADRHFHICGSFKEYLFSFEVRMRVLAGLTAQNRSFGACGYFASGSRMKELPISRSPTWWRNWGLTLSSSKRIADSSIIRPIWKAR